MDEHKDETAECSCSRGGATCQYCRDLAIEIISDMMSAFGPPASEDRH